MILIKMAMPKNCGECPIYEHLSIHGNTFRFCRLTRMETSPIERRDDCPLVELLPHGRLIDADAFDERIRVGNWLEDEDLPDDFRDGIHTTLLMLKSQRTIIEAEEDDEHTD